MFHLESLFYFLSLTAGLVLGSLCGLMTVTTLLTSQLHPPPKKNDKSEKETLILTTGAGQLMVWTSLNTRDDLCWSNWIFKITF